MTELSPGAMSTSSKVFDPSARLWNRQKGGRVSSRFDFSPMMDANESSRLCPLVHELSLVLLLEQQTNLLSLSSLSELLDDVRKVFCRREKGDD